MFSFSFLPILIVVLLPLLAVAASVFHWWGEKKEMEERFPEESSANHDAENREK